jgi:hypothetical protein
MGQNDFPEWIENGVLILGPRKSGTTVFQNLNDGGSQVIVYPAEIKINRFSKIIWENSTKSISKYFKASRIINKEYPNFDKEGYLELVKQLHKTKIGSLKELIQKDMLNVYHNIIKKPSSPLMWIAKEVGVDAQKITSLWTQMFFNGKIMMIMRKPQMVVRSYILAKRRRGKTINMRSIFSKMKTTINMQYSQAELIGHDNIYFVNYEELTKNPKYIMQEVARFLGIKYEKILEYPTIFGERVVTITSSQNTTSVFASREKWFHGLTMKERISVWISLQIITMWGACTTMRRNRRFLQYSVIIKEIEKNRNRILDNFGE